MIALNNRFVKVIAIASLIFVAVILYFMFRINRLSAYLSSNVKISQGLKSEVDTLRRVNTEYEEKIKTVESSSGPELEALRNEKKELSEKLELIENQKKELEKSIEEQKTVLSHVQTETTPSADLRAQLEITENALFETQIELQRLRQNENELTLVPKDKKREIEFIQPDPEVKKQYTEYVEKSEAGLSGKADEMRQKLGKKLSASQKTDPKVQKEMADMHYNMAVILTHQKNFPAAIVEYRKVLEFDPADADSHYNLGVIYDNELKNSLLALEHYRSYVENAPDAEDAARVKRWILDKETELKVGA